MRHFLPIGQIALLSLLVATGSVGGVIAQGRSSQQGAKGITASPSPRTSDPCSSHEASTGSAGTGNALSIEVELPKRQGQQDGVLSFDYVFYVSLTNNSDRPVELWDPDSKRGWCELSFQLADLDSAQKYIVRRPPPDDSIKLVAKKAQNTRDPRRAPGVQRKEGGILQINPFQTFRYSVLLSDCQVSAQDWIGLPKRPNSHRFSIVARFESGAMRSEPQNWPGAIRSDAVEVRILDARHVAPSSYLREGFPAKALRILKFEPSWISNGDEETPLHVAVSSGDKDVVKWLLEHGADVNAAGAKGKYTPLHFASDPEIIALILERKPDLARRGAGGENVLQRAAVHFAAFASLEGRPKWRTIAVESKRKWRSIADLYLKAGAEYDILSAIRLNDFARVKTIVEQSPHAMREFRDPSPLRVGAFLGRLEICRYLIEQQHTDVDDFDGGKGHPIIKDAVAHPAVVQLLIEHGANLKRRFAGDGTIGDNATVLHYAAAYGEPGTIRLLIDNGVDVFVEASAFFGKQTALDVAAERGKANNAAAIIQHVKFQAGNRTKRSQLLNRCLSRGAWPSESQFELDADRPGVIHILLQAGADADLAEEGVPVVRLLARHDYIVISNTEAAYPRDSEEEFNAFVKAALIKEIKVFQQHGARLDLFTAVAIGDEIEVARMLKQNRDLANWRSFDRFPALHEAVFLDHRKIVKRLLDAGCDVNIHDESEGAENDTALSWAAELGRDCIAELLIDRGANVNAVGRYRRTPLDLARLNGHSQIEKLLVEKAAKSGRDESGHSRKAQSNGKGS